MKTEQLQSKVNLWKKPENISMLQNTYVSHEKVRLRRREYKIFSKHALMFHLFNKKRKINILSGKIWNDLQSEIKHLILARPDNRCWTFTRLFSLVTTPTFVNPFQSANLPLLGTEQVTKNRKNPQKCHTIKRRETYQYLFNGGGKKAS